MFTVTELKTYVESVVPGTKVYVNEFPATGADTAIYVRITPGFSPSQWTPKRRPSFQFVVRAKMATAAEELALALLDAFHQRADYVVGGQRIVASFADQSAPFYLGVDDGPRALYSVNFTATLLAN